MGAPGIFGRDEPDSPYRQRRLFDGNPRRPRRRPRPGFRSAIEVAARLVQDAHDPDFAGFDAVDEDEGEAPHHAFARAFTSGTIDQPQFGHPPCLLKNGPDCLLGYVVRGSFKIVVVDSIKVGASALRPLKRLVFADDRHAA